MITQFKRITLAVALGASALAVTAPAEAQRYDGYRGRDNGGAAVIAGVAGLAVGAALASNGDRRDDDYYDEGYAEPIMAYPQVYAGYYEAGYPGYDAYRGHNGYSDGNRSYSDRGGDYGDNDRGGHDRNGRDGDHR